MVAGQSCVEAVDLTVQRERRSRTAEECFEAVGALAAAHEDWSGERRRQNWQKRRQQCR
jgi:hypothetical protein